MSTKEIEPFIINDYLSLKFERDKTYVYVKDRPFYHCKYLMLNIPVDKMSTFDEIDSVDDAAEKLDKSLEYPKKAKVEIPPETEFLGHCSNLQVWANHNYDTRILHSSIAFPLLKMLTEEGDPVAKRVFKEEVAKRFSSGNLNVMNYLLIENYLKYMEKEEFESILDTLDFPSLDISKLLESFMDLKDQRYLKIMLKKIESEIGMSSKHGFVNISNFYLPDSRESYFFLKEDGKEIFFGTDHNELHKYHIFNGFSQFIAQFDKTIESIVLSEDSTLFGLGIGKGTVIIYDIEKNKQVISFKTQGTVQKIYITPDNDFLITVSTDHEYYETSVHIWNLHSQTLHNKYSLSTDFNVADISPDGRSLAFYSNVGKIFIVNIKSKKIVKTLRTTSTIHELYFTTDGKNIIGLTRFDKILLWEVNTGELVHERGFKGFEFDNIKCDIFQMSNPMSPSLICLVLSARKTRLEKLVIYDYRADKILQEFTLIERDGRGECWNVSASKDGKMIVCYILGGYIKCYMKLNNVLKV